LNSEPPRSSGLTWKKLSRRLTAKKPVTGPTVPDGGAVLSRSLTRLDLMVIGVAQIMGAGIFVISGVGVKMAGPGIILSFLVAGGACTLAALCYAELASMMPQAGSAYSYAYGIFGEVFAWIIGWDLILEYGMGAATVAAGWSFYLQDLLRAYGLALLTALFVGCAAPEPCLERGGRGQGFRCQEAPSKLPPLATPKLYQ